MSIKELQAQRNELFDHSEATLTRIAEIDKQIAGESKPKLRHGDIRMWPTRSELGIIDLSEPNCHVIWKNGDKRNCASVNNSKLVGTITEVFDDLKAMQENVTECSLDSCRVKTKRVVFEVDTLEDSLSISIYSRGKREAIICVPLSDSSLKLRQMQATIKRRQKDI